jgi:hypothetical protein
MDTDPEVCMRQVEKDVENKTFHLSETFRYMSFRTCSSLLSYTEQYMKYCEEYNSAFFEDYAERIDCVLAFVKPKWRGYVVVFILNEFIVKAMSDDEFDDRAEIHILFWQKHLFRQKYIGTIMKYSQYTDLLLQAIRLEHRHEDDIKRKAVEERYVTYMWRAFNAFRKNELVEAKKRLAPHKEAIIAAAWHPDRVAKWQEAGVLDDM